jgi:GMP synthase-like glutamine amidotransferase
MARPFLVLQHHPVETPGVFGEALAERGLEVQTVRPDLGQALPSDPGGFAGLLVMGGPMGVYEESRYPWLLDEDRFLRTAMARELPVLGTCLGAQLLAKAAGARVAPGSGKEIGWYRLGLTDAGRTDPLFSDFPSAFDAFEWHGDVFDLPVGAVGLAGSERYPHQAFRLGRAVYGLLFHLEVTAAMVRDMLRVFRAEVDGLGIPGRAEGIAADADRRAKPLNDLGRGLFARFLASAAALEIPGALLG